MYKGTRVQRYTYEGDGIDTYQVLYGPVGTVVDMDYNDDDQVISLTVRWDTGEWEVTDDNVEDVTPKLYVNVYLHDRAYGGSEEGGWWYDTYSPEPGETYFCSTEDEAVAKAAEMQAWCDDENSQRRSDISSVISEGRFVVVREGCPPTPIPASKPYYC